MKYPRTFHLTFSPGCSNDDKMLENNDSFLNKEIIITDKLDGSNLCFSSTDCFARSHAGPPEHRSFDLAKSFHSTIKYSIPEEYLVFMEYCFAKHSIYYDKLDNYFNMIGAYNTIHDKWLSWEDVCAFSKKLSIPTVPILFQGSFAKESHLEKLCNKLMKENGVYSKEREGLVIRVVGEFENKDFSSSVAKIVRANHVSPDSDHWKHVEIIKNKLSK